MSDWGQVRNQNKKKIDRKNDVQFKYEEEDDETDLEEQKQVPLPEAKQDDLVKDKQVTNVEEEKKLVDKEKFRATIKKSFMFGLSSGSMLGCMLGVYDSFQNVSKTGATGNAVIRNVTRSMTMSLVSMGGFFTIYQLTKTIMQLKRDSVDYYNNVTGYALGLLPFMKMSFMRRYFPYTVILFGLDCFSDWRQTHQQNNSQYYVCKKHS